MIKKKKGAEDSLGHFEKLRGLVKETCEGSEKNGGKKEGGQESDKGTGDQ